MTVKNKKYTDDDILKAFTLLFDPDFIFSIHTISCLNPIEIKVAYRKKALETHPDRARLLGKNEREMIDKFREINLAYNKLSSFLDDCKKEYYKNINPFNKYDNHNYNHKTHFSTKQRDCKYTNNKYKKEDTSSDFFYNSYIPNIELLIGQFMYYSGVISWKRLIHAIVWQRNQRPLFGRIAIEWGILSENDIRIILKERSFKEKIGEYALRNKYINNFEHMAIIGKQRSLQRPIGQFFIQNKILFQNDLEILLRRQRIHNYRVRLKRQATFKD